jgi:hypothetical protein
LLGAGAPCAEGSRRGFALRQEMEVQVEQMTMEQTVLKPEVQMTIDETELKREELMEMR